MTRQEFIDNYELEDDVVILEDWESFSGGIIGITEDHCHIIYGYYHLVDSLASSYMKYEKDLTEEEAITMAMEWIDYNTIRSLPYIDSEYRPIICMETEEMIAR